MGHLTYANNAAPIEIADEMLAHLRAVTVTKLRRGESFALTVPTNSHAFETLWIHASIPIQFALDVSVRLERSLLASMMEAASSSGGLDLGDERLAIGVQAARPLHAMSA
ncbi:DUF7882 family protein [Microbacterium sp.]|uniref:DUF7882 family protein n=1 Tax=Microbacterium sp. TaxID=51671 RepID=UPI002FE03D49